MPKAEGDIVRQGFRVTEWLILYKYHMASRETYQNISPEMTRKPWLVMSPDAEGRG